MIVLGISGGHDANIAVIKDGQILAAVEKERFTRIRHDGGDVSALAYEVLHSLNITLDQVDYIATSIPVYKNANSGVQLVNGDTYRDISQYTENEVIFCGRRFKAFYVPHHLCHAAYAALISGMDECAAITWDGGGDVYAGNAFACTSISFWRANKLQFIEKIDNCDFGAIWHIYAASIFGGNIDHAGKLMGLSALGDKTKLLDHFLEKFTVIHTYNSMPVKLIKNCRPDNFDNELLERCKAGWTSTIAQDSAAALQELTVICGLDLCRAVSKTVKTPNLVLSGGVALNGYLNTAIRNEGIFSNVFIPPAVNDGGIGLGAALFCSSHILGKTLVPLPTGDAAFLGLAYDIDIADITSLGLKAHRCTSDEAAAMAARHLAEGKVIGWYEGRSEHGPRALGKRSILASPHIRGVKDRVNSEIKLRESFRPLAAVVREEEKERFFDISWDAPYMMDIVQAKKITKENAIDCLHVDDTSRVQTVRKSDSLHEIISHLHSETGVPILINTSYNRSGPIVETPLEAISIFQQSSLDVTFVNGIYISR